MRRIEKYKLKFNWRIINDTSKLLKFTGKRN